MVPQITAEFGALEEGAARSRRTPSAGANYTQTSSSKILRLGRTTNHAADRMLHRAIRRLVCVNTPGRERILRPWLKLDVRMSDLLYPTPHGEVAASSIASSQSLSGTHDGGKEVGSVSDTPLLALNFSTWAVPLSSTLLKAGAALASLCPFPNPKNAPVSS